MMKVIVLYLLKYSQNTNSSESVIRLIEHKQRYLLDHAN